MRWLLLMRSFMALHSGSLLRSKHFFTASRR